MCLFRCLSFLLACICFPTVIAAQTVRSKPEQTQDFTKILVPITKIKPKVSLKLGPVSGSGITRAGLGFGPGFGLAPKIGLDADYGTGFCLDPLCRLIVTNYHVAIATKARKIQGRYILQRYLATGPLVNGATLHNVPGVGPAAFVTNQDLAIFELLDPLKGHHGLSFDLAEPEPGQQVDIYGFPLTGMNPHRSLAHHSASYAGRTPSGLLAFDLLPYGGRVQLAGASGGIVVNMTGKIVGVLSGTTRYAAFAIPARTLADFVWKVQPFIAAKVFPGEEMSPVSADLYPKFEPAPDLNPKFDPWNPDMLHSRPEDPHDVILLRRKAQQLADSMRNFIAVQNYAWGSKNKEPHVFASYEVRILNGEQRFREYPDGKKELDRLPVPRLLTSDMLFPSDEWSYLPNMLGTTRQLKIRQAADAVVNGRKYKIFQYHSSVEDKLERCEFDDRKFDLGLIRSWKRYYAECYGEVWTDENMNILRISEHYVLPEKLHEYFGVVTYGWIKIANEPSRLLPLTFFTQAGRPASLIWCRGNFTRYRVFTSHSKLGEPTLLADSPWP